MEDETGKQPSSKKITIRVDALCQATGRTLKFEKDVDPAELRDWFYTAGIGIDSVFVTGKRSSKRSTHVVPSNRRAQSSSRGPSLARISARRR